LAGGNIDKLGILVCPLPSFTLIYSNPRRNASFGPRPIQQKSNIPDLVIILNPSENLGLIRECTTMKVPTVGIVDTHTDPRVVTYAIPANMEVSLRSILLCWENIILMLHPATAVRANIRTCAFDAHYCRSRGSGGAVVGCRWTRSVCAAVDSCARFVRGYGGRSCTAYNRR
jgi:hypothetical protein